MTDEHTAMIVEMHITEVNDLASNVAAAAGVINRAVVNSAPIICTADTTESAISKNKTCRSRFGLILINLE